MRDDSGIPVRVTFQVESAAGGHAEVVHLIIMRALAEHGYVADGEVVPHLRAVDDIR